MSLRAYEVFEAIQCLDAWIDPELGTKTGFVYAL
jgi:hypothetical protein